MKCRNYRKQQTIQWLNYALKTKEFFIFPALLDSNFFFFLQNYKLYIPLHSTYLYIYISLHSFLKIPSSNMHYPYFFWYYPYFMNKLLCGALCLVMFDSLRPFGLYLTRLLCPQDFPGEETGVSFHFLRTHISCIFCIAGRSFTC